MHKAGLYLICGPMFSGKTSDLITSLQIASYGDFKVLYVKHKLDTRGDKFSTHNKQMSTNLQIPSITTDNLSNIDVNNYDIIGIDEGQFFDSLEITKEWCKKKRVIIAGLVGDSNRKPFGKIATLLACADDIKMKHAICIKCSTANNKSLTNASFTMKINNVSSVSDKIDVGAGEKYIAVCRDCYESKK